MTALHHGPRHTLRSKSSTSFVFCYLPELARNVPTLTQCQCAIAQRYAYEYDYNGCTRNFGTKRQAWGWTFSKVVPLLMGAVQMALMGLPSAIRHLGCPTTLQVACPLCWKIVAWTLYYDSSSYVSDLLVSQWGGPPRALAIIRVHLNIQVKSDSDSESTEFAPRNQCSRITKHNETQKFRKKITVRVVVTVNSHFCQWFVYFWHYSYFCCLFCSCICSFISSFYSLCPSYVRELRVHVSCPWL